MLAPSAMMVVIVLNEAINSGRCKPDGRARPKAKAMVATLKVQQ